MNFKLKEDLKNLVNELQSASKVIALEQEVPLDEHKIIESIMKLMVKDLKNDDQYKVYYAF